jgi:hypothetical protein
MYRSIVFSSSDALHDNMGASICYHDCVHLLAIPCRRCGSWSCARSSCSGFEKRHNDTLITRNNRFPPPFHFAKYPLRNYSTPRRLGPPQHNRKQHLHRPRVAPSPRSFLGLFGPNSYALRPDPPQRRNATDRFNLQSSHPLSSLNDRLNSQFLPDMHHARGITHRLVLGSGTVVREMDVQI